MTDTFEPTITLPREIAKLAADALSQSHPAPGFTLACRRAISSKIRAALHSTESELAEPEIDAILGLKPGEARAWVLPCDSPADQAEKFARLREEANDLTKAHAWHALAHLLRQRETRANPPDPTGEPNLLDPVAVSPSPPEAAADLEHHPNDPATLLKSLLDDANLAVARGDEGEAAEIIALLHITAEHCPTLAAVDDTVAMLRRMADRLSAELQVQRARVAPDHQP